ncbi:zinc transporter ZntB [Novispirillum itersonii]|uniref:Zinc transporter n=1 Tax=Novispirillum itersonii TaxID=189 RepID=A0A7W9ZEL4_NOVIT|nr:zinc transporter ZntB [Novispirillum itersonii]MBB6209187.1 zinc transporter [Novispirillum itersonii]
MSQSPAILYAFRLTGHGGAEPLEPVEGGLIPALAGATPERPVWVHLNGGPAETRAFLDTVVQAGLIPPMALDALMAEQTRPRCLPMDPGVQINLRGVNLNANADPEDMVSVRLWVSASLAFSVRIRRLLAMEDIRQALEEGKGPQTTGDFLVQVARALGLRVQPVVDALKEEIDTLEEEAEGQHTQGLRDRLAEERRRIIALARYLRPQVDALDTLLGLDLPWLSHRRRQQLATTADRFRRLTEDLDAARDHAAVLQDQIAAALADRLSRTGFSLTVLASVFMPLSFLTGLLGINVAGIPFAEAPQAFWWVCALLVLLAVGQLAFFRFKRLL